MNVPGYAPPRRTCGTTKVVIGTSVWQIRFQSCPPDTKRAFEYSPANMCGQCRCRMSLGRLVVLIGHLRRNDRRIDPIDRCNLTLLLTISIVLENAKCLLRTKKRDRMKDNIVFDYIVGPCGTHLEDES